MKILPMINLRKNISKYIDSWFKLILIQIVKFVGFRKIEEIGL